MNACRGQAQLLRQTKTMEGTINLNFFTWEYDTAHNRYLVLADNGVVIATAKAEHVRNARLLQVNQTTLLSGTMVPCTFVLQAKTKGQDVPRCRRSAHVPVIRHAALARCRASRGERAIDGKDSLRRERHGKQKAWKRTKRARALPG